MKIMSVATTDAPVPFSPHREPQFYLVAVVGEDTLLTTIPVFAMSEQHAMIRARALGRRAVAAKEA